MTGVIYIVIIGLWAVVLIPMWMRRHDQISEVRAAARFSSAMRSLGRGDRTSYALQMSVPAGSPMQESPMAFRSRRAAADYDDVELDYDEYTDDSLDAREYARQTAATRRAIVMGVLTFVLLLVLILAIMSIVPKWTPILAAVPLLAFIVAAIVTASARNEARVERPQRLTPRTMRMPMTARVARDSKASAATDDFETWDAWADEDAWEAVHSTLPTYVSAPRASAVPRGIDRAHPGEWTGQAMVDTARAMRAPLSQHDEMVAALAQEDDLTAEIPVVREQGRGDAASATA